MLYWLAILFVRQRVESVSDINPLSPNVAIMHPIMTYVYLLTFSADK